MREVNKNVILIFISTFLSTFILFYACDTLYFLENKISSSGYMFFTIVAFIVSFILEIPSGIFADKYNKKKILFVSQLLFIIATLIFIYLQNYVFFFIAAIIEAVSGCIATGIANSILYQSCDNKSNFNKLLFIKTVFLNLSYMLAMILGGVIGQKLGLVSTYYLTLIPATLNLVIIGLIKFKNKKDSKKKLPELKIFKKAIFELLNNKMIFNAIITNSVMFSIVELIEESYPEYSTNVGISIAGVGFYTALILLFCIVGNYIGSKLYKKNSSFVIKYSSLIVGFLILLMGILNNKLGILLLLSMYLFSESFDHIFLTQLYSEISEDTSVTCESIISMMLCLFGIVFGIFMTITLKFIDVHQTYIILGAIMLIYSLINIITNNLKLRKGKL